MDTENENQNFIYTDDKIMIKMEWINTIRKVNDCYKFKINNNNLFEFEICKGNPHYQKLDKKLAFSKK